MIGFRRSQLGTPREAVERDQVIWCYRNILGREPESEDVIQAHRKAPSFGQLVKSMIQSREFRAKLFTGMPPSAELPPMSIEVSGSPDDMSRLRSRISNEWERLGESTPFHSVLTDKRFLPEEFRNNEEAFWNSGGTDVADIRAAVARNYPDFDYSGTCIELGCGVGRVTMFLAAMFEKVVALDISQPHIEIARKRAAELGLNNVEFVNVATSELPEPPDCRLFYSRIVLQHNPPPIMKETLESMLLRVMNSGAAMFQLPVYMRDYDFSLGEYLTTPSKGMEMHCLPQREVFQILDKTGFNLQEVRETNDIGQYGDWISNTFFAIKK